MEDKKIMADDEKMMGTHPSSVLGTMQARIIPDPTHGEE